MSTEAKACPAGVPWCVDHETRDNGGQIHRLDGSRTADAWRVGIGFTHAGRKWEYKIGVSGAQWCTPEGEAVDDLVTVEQDGGDLFHMSAEEAYTLAISLLEAVFKVADYPREAIQDWVGVDIAQRLGYPEEVAA